MIQSSQYSAAHPLIVAQKTPRTGRKLQSRSPPCLQHWERAGTWAKGKGPVDPREFGFSQPDVPGHCVLGGVVRARGLAEREESLRWRVFAGRQNLGGSGLVQPDR